MTGAPFSSGIEASNAPPIGGLHRRSVLAQLLGERGGEEWASYRDRVLVFDKRGALPRLAEGTQTFIPVVFTREVERELAPYVKSMHSIVVPPHNAVTTLAKMEIHDNWINKPTHPLKSIFRAWMPQTAASHQQRVDLMKKLADRFPDVVWKICVAQFGQHHEVGDYSDKP